jgi:hypothetical protein
MTARELKDISKTTVEVISSFRETLLMGASFVTDDKIYCIHIAENKMTFVIMRSQEIFRSIPLEEIKQIIDPATAG